MMTDPLADCFARIRNASMASKEVTSMPYSRIKEATIAVLKKEGFVSNVSVEEVGKGKKNLNVTLKYLKDGEPIIQCLKRVSTPGHRVYTGAPTKAVVRSGMGFHILSTSKGIMTDRDAKAQRIGGEILAEAW
jgi:small subunit ribosomal protein S8